MGCVRAETEKRERRKFLRSLWWSERKEFIEKKRDMYFYFKMEQMYLCLWVRVYFHTLLPSRYAYTPATWATLIHNWFLGHILACVCMYVCMYVCIVYILCMYVCMYVCIVCILCLYVCMYALYVFYVCMYVCMYMCVWVGEREWNRRMVISCHCL